MSIYNTIEINNNDINSNIKITNYSRYNKLKVGSSIMFDTTNKYNSKIIVDIYHTIHSNINKIKRYTKKDAVNHRIFQAKNFGYTYGFVVTKINK